MSSIPDLSDRAMDMWLERLPKSIRAAVLAEGESSSIGSGSLMMALARATAADVPGLVRAHEEDAIGFGRARRIRMMAWMADTLPNPLPAFADLTEGEVTGEGEAGSSGGRTGGKTEAVFLEDFKAIAQALGQILGRQMTAGPAMDAVIQAASSLEGDLTMSRGGL